MMMTKNLLLLGLAPLFVVVACGGDDGSTSAASTNPGTTALDGGGTSTTPGDANDPSTADGGTSDPFGNYLRPYAADSPWNMRPVGPVLGTATIPDSVNGWRPSISDGVQYSTGVFLAAASDPPVTVVGPLRDKDMEADLPSLVIPHWPANVTPATGGDGHADIVDPDAKIVHSFNGVTHASDGSWHARDYGWSRLDGRGWGDPAHYFQGARATGVPASAGIIRTHEFKGTDTLYWHALSLSLPHNAIKKGEGSAPTAYVYPATSADALDPSTPNSGAIPEGSLLMLPSTFDSATMPTPELVRIAETLKTYGAFVTDRNTATPYAIYVEIGTGYSLGTAAGVDAALATIQHALRPLASATSWLDGNGKPTVRQPPIDLQTMRGKWDTPAGTKYGAYQTWEQAVVFTKAGETQSSGWNNVRVAWSPFVAGHTYHLVAEASGNGSLRYQVLCNGSSNKADSGTLKDGQTYDIVWPAGTCTPYLTVTSGDATSRIRARLTDPGN